MVTMALRRARLACLALLINIILLSPGPRGQRVVFMISSLCLRYVMIAVSVLRYLGALCMAFWKCRAIFEVLVERFDSFSVMHYVLWCGAAFSSVNKCMFLRLAIVSPSIVVYFGILINILTV